MGIKNIPKFLSKSFTRTYDKNVRQATEIVQDTKASTFDISHNVKTTFDSGKLIPIHNSEVLPGDIINLNIATLIKMSSPQASTMEAAQYDISAYFVPMRVVWENTPYFFGESKTAGIQRNFKSMPVIDYDSPGAQYKESDLGAYLNIPQYIGLQGAKTPVNALYFKAYAKIWNDWYRDQNLQGEIDLYNNGKVDDNVKWSEYMGKPYNSSIQIGQGLAPTSRLSDYFSTALPYTQKGDTVRLPLGQYAPIINNGVGTDQSFPGINLEQELSTYTNSAKTAGKSYLIAKGNYPNSDTSLKNRQDWTTGDNERLAGDTGTVYTSYITDLTRATGTTINQLRLAATLQQLREKEARGGTRYTEVLYSQWGIQASDARLQRAEYIGGFKGQTNINTVLSTATTQNQPVGTQAGYSVNQGQTTNTISYAAEEHGILMVLLTLRPIINYSQGIPKHLTKTHKIEFYNPVFANIGEQPILKREINLTDFNPEQNTEIWGYNEAWAEYRYTNNYLTGFLSVNSPESLANLYTYTEKYGGISPTLSAQWMESSKSIIGDTLLVNSTGQLEYLHQFIGDFYLDFKITRKMPLHGIPGVSKI